MIEGETVRRALTGAWRLARLDTGGLKDFDRTAKGFWQSFAAAAFIFPLFFVLQILQIQHGGGTVDFARAIVILPLGFASVWVAIALIAFHLMELNGKVDRYFDTMVAYHWAAVIQAAVVLAHLTVSELGLLPFEMLALIGVVLQLWIYAFAGYVAYVGLDRHVLLAIAIVVCDVMLGEIMYSIMRASITA